MSFINYGENEKSLNLERNYKTFFCISYTLDFTPNQHLRPSLIFEGKASNLPSFKGV
jgi:hypothetical protein